MEKVKNSLFHTDVNILFQKRIIPHQEDVYKRQEVPLMIMGMGPMSVELSHQEDGLEMGVESGLRRKAVL